MSIDNSQQNAHKRDTNWSWLSVWASKPSESSTVTRSRNGSIQTETDFEEIIHSELQSTDLTALAQESMDSNLHINDQYVDLNDDEKNKEELPHKQNYPHSITNSADNAQTAQDEQQRDTDCQRANEAEETDKTANDAVMISQSVTLRDALHDLERQRDELESETLQLQLHATANDHIIAAQQQEIVDLRREKDEANSAMRAKEQELKEAQQQIARLQRERDALKRKLQEICYNRLNANDRKSTNDTLEAQEVVVSNKHSIYGCIHCSQHLFDSSAIIQRQIEVDDNTFGCLVECLFNNGDTTMGPTVCKTFMNGMFKVKEIFCDGCLATFGWKIIESFDEWNAFHQNKYVIDISHITQITNKSN